MNSDQVGGIVRAIITAIGGVAVTHGYGNSTLWEAVAGAVVILAGAVWSIYSNKPGTVIPSK